MKMMWIERDGPPGTRPASAGFGRRLLERGLDPFHGTVEQRFHAEGFSAQITFVIPEEKEESALAFLRRGTMAASVE